MQNLTTVRGRVQYMTKENIALIIKYMNDDDSI